MAGFNEYCTESSVSKRAGDVLDHRSKHTFQRIQGSVEFLLVTT
jgi:hypothetical protein